MAGQPAHRKGDKNDGNGELDDIRQSSVYVNGKLLSVDGSKGTTHPPEGIHSKGAWQTSGGSSSFLVENKPVNAKTNSDTCGHKRADGSPDFFVPV